MENRSQNVLNQAYSLEFNETRESLLLAVKDLFLQFSENEIPGFDRFSSQDQDKIKDCLKMIIQSPNYSAVSSSIKKLPRIIGKYGTDSMNCVWVSCCLSAWHAFSVIPENILRATVKKHFLSKGCFVDEDSFATKHSGEQLGCIVHVRNATGSISKYYCKTHHNGARNLNTSRTKEPINVAELMTYLLLEQIDVGPQIEFCCHDQHDFYICSRSAAEELLSSTPRATFEPYSSMRVNVDHDSLDRIMSHSRNQKNVARVVEMLYQADLVSRILNISDVINNPGNWGAIFEVEEPKKLRILDFLLTERRNDPWNDFVKGYGIYNYFTCRDPVVHKMIFERDFKFRFVEYRSLFEMIEKRWNPMESFQKVKKFLNEQGLIEKVDMKHGELWLEEIQRNFRIFKEGFQMNETNYNSQKDNLKK